MYWIYGGYVVLSIIAFGLLSLFNANELAAGGRLGRSVCGYIAVFWGVRRDATRRSGCEVAFDGVVVETGLSHADGAVRVVHADLRLRGTATVTHRSGIQFLKSTLGRKVEWR